MGDPLEGGRDGQNDFFHISSQRLKSKLGWAGLGWAGMGWIIIMQIN